MGESRARTKSIECRLRIAKPSRFSTPPLADRTAYSFGDCVSFPARRRWEMPVNARRGGQRSSLLRLGSSRLPGTGGQKFSAAKIHPPAGRVQETCYGLFAGRFAGKANHRARLSFNQIVRIEDRDGIFLGLLFFAPRFALLITLQFALQLIELFMWSCCSSAACRSTACYSLDGLLESPVSASAAAKVLRI